MALEYSLDIATSWPADVVAGEVLEFAQTAGILRRSATVDELLAGTLTAQGTWVRVGQQKERREPWASWDQVFSTFGIRKTVWVYFRLAKTDNIGLQLDDIARVASWVLERVPGDLILQMPGELIWLLRRGGDLSLNERDDVWPPHRLAMITQPYRRATAIFE